MDRQTLEKIIHWTALNGKDKYLPQHISAELQIQTHEIPATVIELVSKLLYKALKHAQKVTEVTEAKSQDELFDLLLTFFETLDTIHQPLATLLNKNTLSISDLSLTAQIYGLSDTIFNSYIQTPIDTGTYAIALTHVLYTWLAETDPILPKTTHRINTLTQLIAPA